MIARYGEINVLDFIDNETESLKKLCFRNFLKKKIRFVFLTKNYKFDEVVRILRNLYRCLDRFLVSDGFLHNLCIQPTPNRFCYFA